MLDGQPWLPGGAKARRINSGAVARQPARVPDQAWRHDDSPARLRWSRTQTAPAARCAARSTGIWIKARRCGRPLLRPVMLLPLPDGGTGGPLHVVAGRAMLRLSNDNLSRVEG